MSQHLGDTKINYKDGEEFIAHTPHSFNFEGCDFEPSFCIALI